MSSKFESNSLFYEGDEKIKTEGNGVADPKNKKLQIYKRDHQILIHFGVFFSPINWDLIIITCIGSRHIS